MRKSSLFRIGVQKKSCKIGFFTPKRKFRLKLAKCTLTVLMLKKWSVRIENRASLVWRLLIAF